MPKSDIIIRIGGEGGEGVISTGDMFTTGAARTGFRVFTFRTYPSEIKGGHAWYQIRVSDRPVLSIGDGIDVLIAFDAEAYERHVGLVHEHGAVISDPDPVSNRERPRRIPCPNSFPETKAEKAVFPAGKNTLTLG